MAKKMAVMPYEDFDPNMVIWQEKSEMNFLPAYKYTLQHLIIHCS